MDDVTPENLNPAELLSAYLDGEVTAAQRAQVEQRLATDPEARAALDELRALSAALQSLPKLSVGEDLSERVLRRAERAMLQRQEVEPAVVAMSAAAPHTSAAQAASNGSGDLPTKNEEKPSLLEFGSSGAGWARRLAWPLAAVAAALLLMFINGKQKEELALVPADRNPQAPQAEESHAPIVQSPRDGESWDAVPDETTEKSVAENSLKPGAGEGGLRADRDALPAGEPRFEQEFRGANIADEAQRPSSGVSAEMKAARSSPQRMDKSQTPSKFGRAARRQSQSSSQITDGTAPAPEAAFSKRPGNDANLGKKQASGFADHRNLVVEVLAAGEAGPRNSFDDLLAMQNIRVEDFTASGQRKHLTPQSPTPENERAKDRQSDSPALEAAPADSAADAKSEKQSSLQSKSSDKLGEKSQKQKIAAPKEKEQSPSTNKRGADNRVAEKPSSLLALRESKPGLPAGEADEQFAGASQGAAAAKDVEVLLVTATPTQVRALLKELESDAGQYRTSSTEQDFTRQLADAQPADARPATAPEKAKASTAAAEKLKLDSAEPLTGYAVRWQVSEDQLAALLTQESLDRQIVAGDLNWFPQESGDTLADTPAEKSPADAPSTVPPPSATKPAAGAAAGAGKPESTKKSAENQQIRVLFVVRNAAPAVQQSQSGNAGQTAESATEQSAAKASPAGEKKPAKAAPPPE
jgi:anti-sigma factor RsiW